MLLKALLKNSINQIKRTKVRRKGDLQEANFVDKHINDSKLVDTFKLVGGGARRN